MTTIRNPAMLEITTLDDVAEQLRRWRADAGNPSFTQLARRVAADRADRGVHPSERTPGRVTVYDCFKPGRRRVDVDLAVDIAAALDVPHHLLDAWRRQCALVQDDAPLTVSAYRGIPTPAERFVGRMSQVEACVRADSPVLIVGMVGAGKTEFASRVLRALLDDGRALDAVTVSMRAGGEGAAPASGLMALDSVARALELPNQSSATASERAATVMRALRDSRTALLIDDVTELEQVEALLAAKPETPVLVCSRFDLAVDVAGLTRVTVEPWTPQETTQYLRELVGDDRVSAEPDAAAELGELVGGLPLAMSLTAARLREHVSWSLGDHAAALKGRLVGLRLDDVVRESIALSYTAVSPQAQRMLRLIGVQPCTELLPEWIAALCAVSPRETDDLIDELARAHCLVVNDERRVSAHSLVRTYSAARSWDEDPERERDAALDRLATVVLAQTWAAVEELHPGFLWRRRAERSAPERVEARSAVSFLALALAPLTQLAESSVQRAPHITVEVGAALSRHLDNSGLYHLGRSLHRRALSAARSIDDAVGEALAHLDLGQNAVRLGLPDAGRHLETASHLAGLAGVPRARVAASNALAILAAQSGDSDSALARFSESLDVARANGFSEQVAPLTDNIAILLRRKGDLAGALLHHRASHDDAARRGDPGGAARTLANMSELQVLMGDASAGAESAMRSRETAMRLGIAITYAYATSSLGLAKAATGDRTGAFALLDEALAAARDMGNHDLEASVLNTIGAVHADGADAGDAGDAAAARDAFLAALEITSREPLSLERVRALHGLALQDAAAGNVAMARERLDEALALLGDSNSPEAQAVRAAAHELGDSG